MDSRFRGNDRRFEEDREWRAELWYLVWPLDGFESGVAPAPCTVWYRAPGAPYGTGVAGAG